MTNRIDSTNCTHDAALARIAELESKLASALNERDHARADYESIKGVSTAADLDRIKNLTSRLHQAELETEAAKQAWRDDREETKRERDAALLSLDTLTKENERLRNMAAGMFWSGGNFDDKTSGEVVALGLDVRSRLDSALATIAEALRVGHRDHSGPSGLCGVLHVLDGTCCFHEIPDDHLHNDCTCSMCRPRVVEKQNAKGESR